jgi:hypothetical protein
MVTLRADPWMPDYGMGYQLPLEEPPARVDPFLETEDWSSPVTPAPCPSTPASFVDGVRRVELRLIADQDGLRAPGLFGSYAVGAVRCDGRAAFADHHVSRAIVLGGGLEPERIEVEVGQERLAFEPAQVPGSEPDRPLWGLQQLMRRAESSLAARVASEQGSVVLADGPLGFVDPTESPVVGVVKRFSRAYLVPEQDALLRRLVPGQRTPVFGLGREEQPLDRCAWYTRLIAVRAPWHDHAGAVRCEVRAGVGLDAAIDLADRVSAMLPSFAGRAGDPRYPQNLAPIGGLEAWLTHRMGHRGMIRRAVTTWLVRQAA